MQWIPYSETKYPTPWRRWFAWRPVRALKTCSNLSMKTVGVWLELVERRQVRDIGKRGFLPFWVYRIPGGWR